MTDAGGSGVKQVTVNNTEVLPQNGSYSYVVTANGSYTIRAVDNAGNESTHTFSVTGIGQPAVPELTLLSQSPDNDTPTNGDVTVRFMVKDLGGNTLAVFPSGTITAVDEANGVYQFIAVANGEYTVTIGSSATSLKVTVSNIDKDSPSCTWVKDEKDWWNEQTLSFKVSDPSGVDSVEVKDPYGQPVSVSQSGSDEYTFIAKVNGDYTIIAKDMLGNEMSIPHSVTRVRTTLYSWHSEEQKLAVSVGETVNSTSPTFVFVDTTEKSSEIAFQYSLSCETETIADNHALTSEDMKKTNYILLEDAVEQKKLIHQPVDGINGYRINLTPGKNYYLVIRPVNRTTGEVFKDGYGTIISWYNTIQVKSS